MRNDITSSSVLETEQSALTKYNKWKIASWRNEINLKTRLMIHILGIS